MNDRGYRCTWRHPKADSERNAIQYLGVEWSWVWSEIGDDWHMGQVSVILEIYLGYPNAEPSHGGFMHAVIGILHKALCIECDDIARWGITLHGFNPHYRALLIKSPHIDELL